MITITFDKSSVYRGFLIGILRLIKLDSTNSSVYFSMIQHQEYVHPEDHKGISLCILEQHLEPIRTTTDFRPVAEIRCGQSCKLDQRCALPVRIFYYNIVNPLMLNVPKCSDFCSKRQDF